MKLLGARLCPFGKFADTSWDLTQPLVVVHGPNEAGKSTLRQAIMHALFTPTNLTPARLKQVMQPWFPLPSGDHAAVRLTFAHAGTTWTLDKRWGVGQATTLTDGTTSIADPESMQAKLATLLAHDEATFRHVLFTGQAELERTLDVIKKESSSGALRDIRDVMKAAAGATGDVDEQKLRRLLDTRITETFSRWDDARERPERQAGEDRGITNPWKRDVGTILAAWYRWQRLVDEHQTILGIEREIDRVNGEAAAVDREILAHESFLQRYGSLRGDLAERGQLEERVPRLEHEVARMREAFAAWPVASAAIDAWMKQQPGLKERQSRLETERKHADARRAGEATTAAFAAITKAKAAWDESKSLALAQKHPGDEALAEMAKLERAIVHAESALAARTLSWRLEAERPESVTIVRGNEPPDTLTVGPDGATGEAKGLVRVQVAGVTLSVTSGNDDVAAIFATLAGDRERLAVLLTSCGVESVAMAQHVGQASREAQATAGSKKQVYEELLRGKSYEAWEAAVQSLAALPATRDLAAIEAEISTGVTQLAAANAACSGHQESISKWTTQFADMETLGERLLEAQSALKAAKGGLADMPDVPPGFATVKAFLEAIERAHSERTAAEQRRSTAREELARLTEKLGERRSEDAADEAELAKRAYERARARGRDLRRIVAELDRITVASSAGPMTAFVDRVAGLFARMTGCEANLEFGNGQLPTSVVREAIAMAPDRLSQGGGGALALAVRLAMAEAYLGEGNGFIMLDDPLVHFDLERMTEAAAIIRQFSSRSQVLYFTCHDHHAEALSRPAEQASS